MWNYRAFLILYVYYLIMIICGLLSLVLGLTGFKLFEVFIFVINSSTLDYLLFKGLIECVILLILSSLIIGLGFSFQILTFEFYKSLLGKEESDEEEI